MMNSVVRSQILKTFRYLVGGIVKLALRNGINFKEFSNICKTAYVEVAVKEYGIKGRPTNTSRVALMTGLDRREIKRISETINTQDEIRAAPPSDRIGKILAGWYTDKHYLNDQNEPIDLPLEGVKPSFESLIKDYGGDIAVVTVLREFRRSFTVLDTEEGKLKVNARYYIPNYQSNADKAPDFVSPEAIAHGSSMLIDHVNTIFHNLYRKDMGERERFEIRATNTAIDKRKTGEFYALIDKRGLEFLTEIDEWLNKNEIDDLSKPHERFGVGLYFIQGDTNPLIKKNGSPNAMDSPT